MAKSKTGEQAVPSFEEAVQQLQEIVEALEAGELGLQESLGKFEEGIGLLKTCNEVLERAEQQIEVLTGVDAEGNPTTGDFDGSATFEAGVSD